MHNLIKIAVDAMGGDGSPKKIIDGIIHNHKLNKENFFKIFGNKTSASRVIAVPDNSISSTAPLI